MTSQYWGHYDYGEYICHSGETAFGRLKGGWMVAGIMSVSGQPPRR
jgi:hypothetical protein